MLDEIGGSPRQGRRPGRDGRSTRCGPSCCWRAARRPGAERLLRRGVEEMRTSGSRAWSRRRRALELVALATALTAHAGSPEPPGASPRRRRAGRPGGRGGRAPGRRARGGPGLPGHRHGAGRARRPWQLRLDARRPRGRRAAAGPGPRVRLQPLVPGDGLGAAGGLRRARPRRVASPARGVRRPARPGAAWRGRARCSRAVTSSG